MFKYFLKFNNKRCFCFLCMIFCFLQLTVNNSVTSYVDLHYRIDSTKEDNQGLIPIFPSTPILYIYSGRKESFYLSQSSGSINARRIEYGPNEDVRLFICLTKDDSEFPEFSRGIWYELDSSKYKNYCMKKDENYILIGHVYSKRPDIKGTLKDLPSEGSFEHPPSGMKTDMSYDKKYLRIYDEGVYTIVYSIIPSIKYYFNDSKYRIMILKLSSDNWYQIWGKNGESNGFQGAAPSLSNYNYIRFTLGQEPHVIFETWLPKNLWNLCVMVRMYGVRVNNRILVKQCESLISSYNLTVDNPWGNVAENEQQNAFETALKSLTGIESNK